MMQEAMPSAMADSRRKPRIRKWAVVSGSRERAWSVKEG